MSIVEKLKRGISDSSRGCFSSSDVRDTLRACVMDHQIDPDTRLPSVRQLSALFETSTVTTQKALRELVSENVVYQVQGKGTFVALRSKKERRTPMRHVVGVLALSVGDSLEIDTSHSVSAFDCIRGVESVLSEKDYNISILGKRKHLICSPEKLETLPVDGFMALHPKPEHTRLLTTLKSTGKPLVATHCHNEIEGIHRVNWNLIQAGYEPTKYLINQGKRRIFTNLHRLRSGPGSIHYEGYEKAMREAGLPLPHCQITQDLMKDPYLTEADIQLILECGDAFVSFDSVAARVMKAALAKDLRVPEEFAVFGYFNRDFCEYLNPPLASVAIDHPELGRVAARQLLHIISNPACSPETIYVDVTVIPRESAGRTASTGSKA